ncbi:hypothetical protein CNMCM8927_000884 [Aspergillus lentulus]|uniref:Uncharacterized protein n=1 Tax=Aspergillus lentulus TaxID=293939 RepID=A0AAN5YKN4_ASPLE|nr:hypothetical protein CNMCM8927_000884 [Aspergillus lentulus]
MLPFGTTPYAKCAHPLNDGVFLSIHVRNAKRDTHQMRNMRICQSTSPSTYIWNSNERVPGSYYPVAVDAASTSPETRAMDILMELDETMIGVPMIVTGIIDYREVITSTEKYFATSGRENVDSQSHTESNYHINNTSRLGIYAMNADLPRFFKSVVPVNLLPEFVLRHSITGPWVPWVLHCYRKVFSDSEFKFDTQFTLTDLMLSKLENLFG